MQLLQGLIVLFPKTAYLTAPKGEINRKCCFRGVGSQSIAQNFELVFLFADE